MERLVQELTEEIASQGEAKVEELSRMQHQVDALHRTSRAREEALHASEARATGMALQVQLLREQLARASRERKQLKAQLAQVRRTSDGHRQQSEQLAQQVGAAQQPQQQPQQRPCLQQVHHLARMQLEQLALGEGGI
jgi:hypothetical protein